MEADMNAGCEGNPRWETSSQVYERSVPHPFVSKHNPYTITRQKY